jgi:CubicO group peptidase (beta-lactamase class C family)
MIAKLVRTAALLSLLTGVAWAKPRPAVEPAKVGLDPAKLAGLHAALQRYVDQKQVTGAVTVIGRQGHLASFEVVGLRDREGNKSMETDTVFRIASMSKIATAVAVMMLEDDGKLSVDDPVEKYLPEFRGQKLIQELKDIKELKDVKGPATALTLVTPERPITIKDLMTHTSGMNCGLPAGFADLYSKRNRPLVEAVVAFSQHPLISAPGKVWKYCGPAYDTLGRIIEVASGKRFETFMDERLFRPLGMKDTTFHPSAAQRARLAIIYEKDGDSLKRPEHQDFGPENIVYPAASGGLFSTALDYSKLCQLLADRGKFAGKQLLRPETVTKMTSVHFTYAEKVGFTPGLGMGLGVQVVMKPTGVTAMLPTGSFGHGGAFGTQAWIDPKNELYFVLMIQRRNFTEFGNGDMSDIRKTLQEFGEAALAPKTAAAP